ncbi:hypothetical protein HID58_066679, partial [Brassica napus]
QLEPRWSILMHNKVLSVGFLQDVVDPMVYVMKVENTPLDSYVDLCVSLVTFIFSIPCTCILLNQGSFKIINHHAFFKWSYQKETYSQGLKVLHQSEVHIRTWSVSPSLNKGNKQSSSSIAKPSRAWINLSDPRSFKTMGWYGQILHQKQATPGKPSS